ncbi:polysaccharide biosynthesis protein [Brevibacterium casei S18]|uniref:Polysaccharide biosynthesis protein n=1 Tax=Brevibacterium casei S18 TaxID=1229781 RepID=K9AYU2_9MICO|nr:polysaccharide biosynthesis protein [Brevibacterium casei S18]
MLRGIGGDTLAVGLGQLAAFVYPIVSLPLLTRLLGPHSFGRVVIIVAVLQLLVRLCDYGFSVSAVRRMALAKDQKERSGVIASTMLAVILLWAAGTILLLSVVSLVPALRDEFPLYLIGALVIAGGIGFPSWLLQGLRRLKLFAIVTAVSRAAALVGLLITVSGQDDIAWAIAWQFAPPTIAAAIVWPILLRGTVQVTRPRFIAARFALRDGRHLFLSSIAHSLMGSAPVVVLGLVSVPAQAASYGAAERFGNAGRGVLFTITDSLMPRMVDAQGRTRSGGRRQQQVIMAAVFALFALAGAVLIVSAAWFVPWYLGPGYDEVVPVTQIIGIALVASGGIAVLMLDLNSQGRYSATASAMICGAVIHLVVLVPMAMSFGALGAAWALVVGELCISVILIFLRVRWNTIRDASLMKFERKLPTMNAERLDPEHIARRTRDAAVTVVVPAFNAADSLPRTLRSLAEQTSQDFCVLVIDDGSDSPMLEFLPDDSRFLGCRLSTNRGYAGVTNHALDLVGSRWVIFVDADDSLAPDCIETLLARGEAENADIVVMPLLVIDTAGRARVGQFAEVASPLPARKALDMFIAGRFYFNQHMLFRPNHVRARDNTYSDLSFVVNLLSTVTRVSFESRPLYHYHLSSGSVTAQLRPTVWDLVTVLDDVEDALRNVYQDTQLVTALHRLRWMQLGHMVSRAAGDSGSPRLRDEVYEWCRAEVRFSHVVDAVRTRHWGKGLSLALVRMSPSAHFRAFQLRSRLKELST